MARAAGLPIVLLGALGGCGSLSRLSEVGRAPEMTPITDPTKAADYRPLTMPMPAPQMATPQANALWRNGSRAFFKDQRAAGVGDLLTVVVNVTDAADVQNNTTAGHTGSETMGLPNLFGLESQVPKLLAGATASTLVSGSSANSSVGTGTLKRNETVTLRLAGMITQVLPNGNLVVSAHQEMRVNSELRDLQVSGVIRPQDIASDNTVLHDRMAEARITYGGKGQLADQQQPRWGQQVLDILLPF
jgi:flagellar L-ring protein precursor FlgH